MELVNKDKDEANVSAASLPETPKCAGSHDSSALGPLCIACRFKRCISQVRFLFGRDFKLLVADHLESVKTAHELAGFLSMYCKASRSTASSVTVVDDLWVSEAQIPIACHVSATEQ